MLHHQCHNNLAETNTKIDAAIQDLKSRSALAEDRLRRANSLFYKLRRAVGGEAIDIAACEHELSKNTDVLQQLMERKTEITKKLTVLYDYWPSYPPDWEQRKREARAETHSCSRCHSSRSMLHVHHKQPVAKGGNHTFENLIVLCEKCHSRKHGGREFTYGNDDEVGESSFEKRLAVLRSAIDGDQMVRFSYTRRDGRQSVRTISPGGFETVENTLCVNGYCYLRKEERTFAVKRMKNVHYVDETGESYYKKRKKRA
jgi:HNH endonuclease/WYL domain